MVMKPEPMVRGIEKIRGEGPDARVILLSPQGRPFCQDKARELSERNRLILVCGRYEGVDERVRLLAVDEEISIGDYVLTGGETAAMVVLDATTRLLPGVLGDENSPREESFSQGLLEYPQYTRPREFMDHRVPDILLSGDHGKIETWRKRKSIERTLRNRPDLLGKAELSEKDRAYLDRLREEGLPEA